MGSQKGGGLIRYIYYCSECKKSAEIEKSMKIALRPEYCPYCRMEMGRDWQAEGAQGATAALHTDIHKYPYVSARLPKNLPGCDHDAKGKPVIVSKSHEREVMARHGYRRD